MRYIFRYLPFITVSILLAIFSMGIFSCQSDSSENQKKIDPSYVSEINKWHQKRVESLKKPIGWLTLAGLFWLEEGENRFGADSSNDIIFPENEAPDFMGTLVLRDSTITVEINPNINVKHEGESIRNIEMKPDVTGDPTRLNYGSLSWIIIKRDERFAVRLWDTDHQRLNEFEGIERFPVNPKWRVTARFQPYDPPKTIEVPTILGTVNQSPTPGALVFEIGDEKYHLDPIAEPDDKRWFIIFADETNGTQTYGAGRYVYVDNPGADGTTVIDFNKAYNPPCVFTHYATCPFPPEQNYLPIKVTAGEKKYENNSH